MRLMYSGELYHLLRDISVQNGGMPLSVFEPPQRYSWSDPSLNFYNSVAYPLPETDEGHSFCSLARKSRVLDDICLSCDRRYTDECEKSGRSVTYRCHLGFLEGLIPVPVAGGCACIFLGQVCDSPPEESWPRVWETLEVIDPKYFTSIGDISGLTVYKNNYYLPLGYAVSDDIVNWEHATGNPFYAQNDSLRRAAGGCDGVRRPAVRRQPVQARLHHRAFDVDRDLRLRPGGQSAAAGGSALQQKRGIAKPAHAGQYQQGAEDYRQCPPGQAPVAGPFHQ